MSTFGFEELFKKTRFGRFPRFARGDLGRSLSYA
jgi:hypothetical protein